MQKNVPYILISFGISIIVCVLSFLDIYDNFEHNLLDMRFKSRGLIETRDDIATADIDVRALQTEGKWDPWSREKHIPLVNLSAEHGLDAFIFDVYFIEDSERKLEYKVLKSVTDSTLTMEQVESLFPDPDNDLASASKKAGNIIFAQSFKPQGEKKTPVKKRTKVMERRLNLLEKKNLFRRVDPKKYSSLFDFYDIETVVDTLIKSSAGVYFFQSDPDPDGLQRKYPLIGLYEDKIFPSASLAIALQHYNVSFDSVQIVPGKHIYFKLPEADEHGRDEIYIPINPKGQMQVNWAGNWEDKETGEFDLVHYPYNVLKEFQKNEYQNYVLAEFKSLANKSFAGNVKAAYKPALATINASKKDILNAVKKTMMMGAVEKWINENPNGKATDFPRPIPVEQFNELKNNIIFANVFLDSNRTFIPNLDDLIRKNLIHYEFGIEDYTFTTIRQHIKDLTLLIDQKDENQKDLLKTRGKANNTKRNFQIIANLHKNNMIDEQRPLSFYPYAKKQRLFIGSEEKKTVRDIVPFEFVGKKLYYGLTATGTSDLNPMPFDPRYPMVGLHANALNTILDNKIIYEVPKTYVALIIIAIGSLLSFGVPALSAAVGGLVTAIIVGSYGWLSFWLFSNHHVWLDMVGPLSTLGIGYLGITVYNYIQEEKNKNFLKDSFGTYVSPELIDQMYESGEEPSLGGEEGYHTAFFTDIQSFSAFSEKLTASELVALLNQYLTDMTDVLLENNGTLDKYIGDAIVAFYGAPIEVEDHELWACRTAIKMQENLEILKTGWREEGDRWPEIVHNMQNRIGISSGQMVTGNMGSESRMNYTMMGDNVNTAARLESSAKQYGIYIQIADSTYQPIKEKLVVRDLDNVRVLGKEEPVKVWELISEVGKEPEQYKKILPAYNEALKLYQDQEWSKAIEAFKVSDALEDMFPGRKTNPSRIYIPRCEHFQSNPPGDEWDGVWTLTSK
ncbi:CHASE2 domain-containing protein [Candidatus Marinimicrobia bacterium]|nr:CHASE2 domain-containing protein [Candidatus Neomarinimicrobiota bacterium]